MKTNIIKHFKNKFYNFKNAHILNTIQISYMFLL